MVVPIRKKGDESSFENHKCFSLISNRIQVIHEDYSLPIT